MSFDLAWRHFVIGMIFLGFSTIFFGWFFPSAVTILSRSFTSSDSESPYVISFDDLAKLQRYGRENRRYFSPRFSTTLEHPYNLSVSSSVVSPIYGIEGQKLLMNRLREIGGEDIPYEQALLDLPDALSISSSGLDPHITFENALFQAPFVAKARGVDPKDVEALVQVAMDSVPLYDWALFPPVLNVISLNEKLDMYFP